MTIKKIIVDKIISDSKMKLKLGHDFDRSHYRVIVNYDCDGYTKDGQLLFKFRKKVIPKGLCNKAVDSFGKYAQALHENRGNAAGLLDTNKTRGYVGKLVDKSAVSSKYISTVTNKLGKTVITNLSPSNIAGFYDRPDRNTKNMGEKCRKTAFNKKHLEKWNDVVPFIKQIDKLFKKLVPDRHAKQLERARKKPKYQIDDTCFTTLTLNYSWRTSCHKDKGDYDDGFGNLIVCEDANNSNKYLGCELGFPQYGVCVDVRQGDYLAMNVHEYHCNTEFIPNHNNKLNISDKKVKNEWHYNRLSMVFYLRKNMIKCDD